MMFKYPACSLMGGVVVLQDSWHSVALADCAAEVDRITDWQDKGYGKRLCNRGLPKRLAALIREASDPPFLAWLEQLTGIDGLLPDAYLVGGGVHSSLPGGYLRMHTDFNYLAKLGLYRRLNLLLYLSTGSGGDLLLGERRILAERGTMVIFETNDRSWHGHPEACTGRRDSVALYYYTAHKPDGFVEQLTTNYDYRPSSTRPQS